MKARTVLLVALVAFVALTTVHASSLSRLQSSLRRSVKPGAIPLTAAIVASEAPASAAAAAEPAAFSTLSTLQSLSFSNRARLVAASTTTAALSTGAIVGIVVAAVVVFLFLVWVCSYHNDVMASGAPAGGTTIINTGAPQPATTGTTVVAR
jgi:hypothetical protein